MAWGRKHMRKILCMGSLLAALLVMMVPLVSAAEYKTIETQLNNPIIQSIAPQDLKKGSNDPQPNTFIILTLLILFLKLVRFVLSKFKVSNIFFALFLMWLFNLFS